MWIFEFILKWFLLSLYIKQYNSLKYIYKSLEDTDVTTTFSQINLIKSVKANSNLHCLSQCDRLMNCLSATYNSQLVCNLYNNTITNQTNETKAVYLTTLSYKKFSTINESCVRTECDHRKLLECSDSMCRCNPTDNTWCVEQLRCAKWPQIVPNVACSWNCECDNAFGLVCSNNLCQCDPLSSYNTWCSAQSRCARPPGTYNSICQWNCECDSTVGLVCSGSSCICDSTKLENTWCNAQSRCARYPGSYTATCTWNCECDASIGLICSGSSCICDSSKIENTWCSTQSRCARSPRSLNAQCTWNCECDSSLGLICDGTNCQCNPSNSLARTWCAEQSRCARSPGSYSSACTWDCECDASVSLACINSVCNCKNSSVQWTGSQCDLTIMTTYITGDAQTSWGTWGTEEICPNRTTISGYQLQIADSCGANCDNTALDTIVLECDTPDKKTLTSSRGANGNTGNYWKDWQHCPAGSVLIGFSLRSQPNQGSGDDTAANDLHMKCSDGSILTNSSGATWGSFGAWITCSIGHICGIKTLVEAYQGSGDETTLNNVQFTCCYP